MTTPGKSTTRAERALARRLRRADLAFDAGILELRLARDPGNVALLAALAEHCTRLRRYEQGLALDRRLVATDPTDPVYRYNLACSLVLVGRLDEACEELAVAARHGYRDFDHMERDPDLRRLRRDPRYAALLARLLRIVRGTDAAAASADEGEDADGEGSSEGDEREAGAGSAD